MDLLQILSLLGMTGGQQKQPEMPTNPAPEGSPAPEANAPAPSQNAPAPQTNNPAPAGPQPTHSMGVKHGLLDQTLRALTIYGGFAGGGVRGGLGAIDYFKNEDDMAASALSDAAARGLTLEQAQGLYPNVNFSGHERDSPGGVDYQGNPKPSGVIDYPTTPEQVTKANIAQSREAQSFENFGANMDSEQMANVGNLNQRFALPRDSRMNRATLNEGIPEGGYDEGHFATHTQITPEGTQVDVRPLGPLERAYSASELRDIQIPPGTHMATFPALSGVGPDGEIIPRVNVRLIDAETGRAMTSLEFLQKDAALRFPGDPLKQNEEVIKNLRGGGEGGAESKVAPGSVGDVFKRYRDQYRKETGKDFSPDQAAHVQEILSKKPEPTYGGRIQNKSHDEQIGEYLGISSQGGGGKALSEKDANQQAEELFMKAFPESGGSSDIPEHGYLGTVSNSKGNGYSSELSIGVSDQRLNGGKDTNIPLLVPGQVDPQGLADGKKPTKQQVDIATDYAATRSMQGAMFPAYDSPELAGRAAQLRHEAVARREEEAKNPQIAPPSGIGGNLRAGMGQPLEPPKEKPKKKKLTDLNPDSIKMAVLSTKDELSKDGPQAAGAHIAAIMQAMDLADADKRVLVKGIVDQLGVDPGTKLEVIKNAVGALN